MSKATNLNALMAEGMSVYPAGTFGAFVADRPPHIDGAPKRVARAAGPVDNLVGRTVAWGSTNASGQVLGATPRRVTPGERERNRQAFMRWLKAEMPTIYAKAIATKDAPPPGSALGAESPSTWERLLDNIGNLAQVGLTYKTQKQVLDMQLDRARQGLPPLNTSQYAPTVRITTDMATMYNAAGGAMAQFKPMILPAAAIIGLLFFMNRKKRR